MINKITNWWMSLLNGGVNTTESCTANNEPVVRVITEDEVGEPVISFVKTVKANPSRFIFLEEYQGICETGYYCHDRKLNKHYGICVYIYYVCGNEHYHVGGVLSHSRGIKLEDISFLTKVEIAFIYQELSLSKEKQKKYEELKRKRERANQRRRLTKLYKDTNND